ncbi:MAG: (2Fe-2S)-binding protein [Planctomycetales bacterium]|nr:(2Fe-2S)-binding protein [Planctomycetales bacterium]
MNRDQLARIAVGDDERGGVSRRAFIKGSGAAAAATAIAQGAIVMADEAPTSTAVVGPEATAITMTVNGRQRTVSAEPRATLLEVLRTQLDLTGAKPVSSDGSSGASTVWLDEKPVSASTTLAIECEGKSVRTVETLGGVKPDPVVSAFAAHDAMQCGFCTPGFVVAVRAFLDKNPTASEDEIRAGLNGNLCRCGTYANVIAAALDVVKGGSNG